MKIAFFGTKPYDKKYFSEMAGKHDIKFFKPKLSSETSVMAAGYDAVCVFVNDDVNCEVINDLADRDVKYILLRCAGFNNVDLESAKKRGIKVARVPSYSPEAVAEHAIALVINKA